MRIAPLPTPAWAADLEAAVRASVERYRGHRSHDDAYAALFKEVAILLDAVIDAKIQEALRDRD